MQRIIKFDPPLCLMSSFSVFDAKGGEFEGPKASIKLMSTSGNGPRKGGKRIMD